MTPGFGADSLQIGICLRISGRERSESVERKKKEALQGIIYVLPSFILIACFSILPIFMSGYFSFTNYNVMNDPTFAALDK